MTNTVRVPDLPADESSITDRDAVEYMKQLTRDRRDKGVMIPRFVQALNKAGYSIALSEYKAIESKPFGAIEHVRNGLISVAYRVLNKVRVENSQQDSITAYAMIQIAQARIARDLSYLEMAQELSRSLGTPISEAEYRTAEQGIAKTVPFSWVIACTRYLDVNLGGLFT